MYEFAVAAMFGVHVAVVCQNIFDGAVADALRQTQLQAAALWRESFPHVSLLGCLQNACLTYRIPPEGTAYSPPTGELTGQRLDVPYFVEDICPQLFAQVRHLSGVTNERYYESICRPDIEFVEFRTNSRSGEFFFFSHDGKFMLKTTTRREAETLMRMLPDMIARFKAAPHSLLGRYLGLYRVYGSDLEYDLLFFVMLSVAQNSVPVHRIYDLKGSTKGRRSKPEEGTRKDANFNDELGHLDLAPVTAAELVVTHSEDVEILRRHAVLDYSVLLHVHDLTAKPERGSVTRKRTALRNFVRVATGRLDQSNRWHAQIVRSQASPGLEVRTGADTPDCTGAPLPPWRPWSGLPSQDGRYLYTLSLIDLLVPFYWKKRVEAAGHEVVTCGSRQASVIHPEAYAERQVEMMERICRQPAAAHSSSEGEASDADGTSGSGAEPSDEPRPRAPHGCCGFSGPACRRRG